MKEEDRKRGSESVRVANIKSQYLTGEIYNTQSSNT